MRVHEQCPANEPNGAEYTKGIFFFLFGASGDTREQANGEKVSNDQRATRPRAQCGRVER